MTYEEMQEMFETDNDEHGEFQRVENKLNGRPDIHAYLLLDSLFPGDRDMVSAAEHDIIYLAPDAEELAKVATEEQVLELIRCGVFVDTETDSLAMFV